MMGALDRRLRALEAGSASAVPLVTLCERAGGLGRIGGREPLTWAAAPNHPRAGRRSLQQQPACRVADRQLAVSPDRQCQRNRFKFDRDPAEERVGHERLRRWIGGTLLAWKDAAAR